MRGKLLPIKSKIKFLISTVPLELEMSHPNFVSVEPKKPYISKVLSGSATTFVEEGVTTGDSLQEFICDGFFEDSDQGSHPVQVRGDTIRVREQLMQDGQPYAFSYQGRDYMISKKDGSVNLYELRD